MHGKGVAIIILAGLLVVSPAIALAAGGDLDTNFAADGIAITDIGGDSDWARGTAVQSDGKLVVVGASFNGSDNDFAVVRYRRNGSLDTTFSGDGKVTIDIAGNADVAVAVAIQSDGKIVVAGHSYIGSDFDFAVARFNPNGALDATFSGDGVVTTPIGPTNDFVYSIAIQEDGMIIVAGESDNGPDMDFAVVRYQSDGDLDDTFDGDGIITQDFFGSDDSGRSVAIQANGKIVVAGESYNGPDIDFAVARFHTNGTLDITITADLGGFDGGNSVAIQEDGKIVVAGYTDIGQSEFAVARFNPDGSLDTTFDGDSGTGNGMVTTTFDGGQGIGHSVAIQRNQRIVVGGYITGANDDFALVRYRSDGSLDTSFGTDGRVITSIGSGFDWGYSVAIQNDRTIVLAGVSHNGANDDFAVVRYESGLPRNVNQSTRTVDVNPSGGSCASNSTAWSVRFRGTYALPTDCTRDGFAFVGWTRDPELTEPEHLIKTISRSGSVTAVWGELPTAPSVVSVLANFLCLRNCDTALVAWPASNAPDYTPIVTIDGVETNCSTRGDTLDFDWCWVTGLTTQASHTTSVAWRNRYGTGPATSISFNLN